LNDLDTKTTLKINTVINTFAHNMENPFVMCIPALQVTFFFSHSRYQSFDSGAMVSFTYSLKWSVRPPTLLSGVVQRDTNNSGSNCVSVRHPAALFCLQMNIHLYHERYRFSSSSCSR